MEKRHIDRRLEQMSAEGTHFRAGVNVGVDITAEELRSQFDAVVLAGGATAWRDLPIPGRDLDGIHQAMEYLPWANRVQQGDRTEDDEDGEPPITAKGKRSSSSAVATPVPTASARCTARAPKRAPVRDHAAAAGDARRLHPWPVYPLMFRVSPPTRRAVTASTPSTPRSSSARRQGHALRGHEVKMADGKFEKLEGSGLRVGGRPGAARDGLRRPEREGLLSDLNVEITDRGNVARDANFATSVPGVFVAGDMGRGQSLIVWAIAEGGAAAAGYT